MKQFEQGELLTAARLNDMLRELESMPLPEVGSHVVTRPAPQALPGPAWYNVQTDSCTGSVSLDCAGLVASVAYAELEAPRIEAGAVQLPLAHDFSPAEDSSLPDEQSTGGISGIESQEGLHRPQIDRGRILLPLAQSDWGDAEGAMYTPGLVYAVEQDACTGAAYISQGIIHLPPSSGGGGDGGTWPALSIAASADETWSAVGGALQVGLADMCSGSAGVVSRVETGDSLGLSQGVLTVPLGGGSLAGVVNTSGQQVTWAEMVAAPVRLAVLFLDGYRLYITGQVIDGFLQINTEAV